MTDATIPLAADFARVLQAVSPTWLNRQTKTRCTLPENDSMESMITGSLLRESLMHHLSAHPLEENALVVFMDRRGGKAGGAVSATIIQLLGEMQMGISYVHVAFVTPPRGIGSLLRATLARKGAEHGVLVDVVSENIPAEGLAQESQNADALLKGVPLVITYASDGSAGLIAHDMTTPDPLIAASHINVLSFPDPEFSVADLPRYEKVLSERPAFKHIRFWVQVLENSNWNTLGHCTAGRGGDAGDRLWHLIDNAKRLPWRLLAEPMAHNVPVGSPLHFPCRTVLETHFSVGSRIDRLVTAGNNIVLVGPGLRT